MFGELDIRLLSTTIASGLAVIGYMPYIRDIFKNKTKPHFYTWFIWVATQAIALTALIKGGDEFGVISLAVNTGLILFVFLLSFKYGTRDITKGDKIIIVLALLAIVAWWQLDNLLMAVFIISIISGLGYVLTLRRSYSEPWLETTSYWLIMTISTVLILTSLSAYNLLTVTYLAVLSVGNLSLYIMLLWRRRYVVAPNYLNIPN